MWKLLFLNGDLEKEVCMKQSEGFCTDKDNYLVCKLNKTIYGLKQLLANGMWSFTMMLLYMVLMKTFLINVYT